MNRCLVLCLTIIVVAVAYVAAEIPTAINYQGRLTNPDGSLVADDGLHPSAKQYRQWIGEILPNLLYY